LLARAIVTFDRVGTSDPVTVTVDTVAPRVLAVEPADGYDLAFSFSSLVITFDEAVQPASLALVLSPDPGGWHYTWNADHTQVTAIHDNRFTMAAEYPVTVTVRDLAGNLLTPPFTWAFFTALRGLYYPLFFK